MNSRLDHAGDRAILTEIKSLQTDIAQLKAAQQAVDPALITHAYVSETTNTVDAGPITMAAGATHQFTLTFTGDGSVPFPYGVQFSQVFNGGTDSAHQLSDYMMVDSTGTYYNWALGGSNSDPNHPSIWWGIIVTAGSSGATIYVKFRTLTTSMGGWSASW